MSPPARLLSVRLQGFKSFADRTHVEFGPGISAVVGPNGSGKSNLADALRWALGEQGRALRTRKSEDVVWAGSEKRPAVGMADVQLTLDNGDGLLPVEYGVVELGRRLYRSGENDYLLNRQRVRLKDLVDLLDAGHLAENAFLFIGQGMVDQALALRPEERRPLFEEVAGVRRHERRRRRAEEQLVESEANLARVDDILAELRPQARRLAQQAEQQASRRSAADDLAAALLLSGHARWHAAAARADGAASSMAASREALDGALRELVEHERAMAAASATLAGQAVAEAEARSALDGAREARAALQLREGRHASEVAAAARERAGIEQSRVASAADVESARKELARSVPAAPDDLIAELAGIDADLALGAATEPATVDSGGASPAEAAAIRRLEAARAQEHATARRRAAEAERLAADESARAAAAVQRGVEAGLARDDAAAALAAAIATEAAAREQRETVQDALAAAESAARAATDRLAGSRAAAAAAAARHDDATRALEAAEGAAFSKAARARGGRSIGDGLIVEAPLQRAVDAALSGLGRAHLLPRAEIAALTADRGVAVIAEAVGAAARDTAGDAGRRIVEAARLHGGGPLAEAVRRDDTGAVTRILGRVVWVPDAAACLALQADLPPGWLVVDRDGTLLAGDVATWTRPDGRGLHLRADVERTQLDIARTSAAVTEASAAAVVAESAMSDARAALARARDQETTAATARRRAEEQERAAASRADAAARESAWLGGQVSRLEAEASRLRAAIPPEPAARPAGDIDRDTAENVSAGAPARHGDAATRERHASLERRREALARDIELARLARATAERDRAQAEAAVALGERQLAYAARMAGDLAEREARLAAEREDLRAALADADGAVAQAAATLASVLAETREERDHLKAAEVDVAGVRDRVRIAQERARIAERDDVEARLAAEALREQLLVELAGLGATAIRHLRGDGESDAAASADDDGDPEALERAIDVAAVAWRESPPPAEPPSPARLAALRRRFHDLGAVNPFAADEYADVRTRLDGLEGQRADIQTAIERTRELIAELDKLVSEQFRRTFDALERAFDERFRQLFGGGFAKLALTDPQDLAATGIEITARPPGKKPQALAMLSGGERALTAVALLFAMLEVRPVPFCVLDEVDAALDEANIGRFTDALRDLAKATQCIVITHNRGTIEAADALYGVTVGDDSVSRVISLRLEEATALAARSQATRATAVPVGLGVGGE
ncbi:MAG TPA: chromosome segregation protein SMC [Candidatus Dormibacteraeota bacterium]|nr:chromosome segregation protein SMC [Candidatus Dormibacteraeota bacterium]